MHNQPDVPLPDNGGKPGKKKITEGPPPPPSPPPPPVTPGQDQNNVGNKLLKMMGWKEGTGLGSTGEGRVDPMYVVVSVAVYLNVDPLQSNSDLRARGRFGSQQRQGDRKICGRI